MSSAVLALPWESLLETSLSRLLGRGVAARCQDLSCSPRRLIPAQAILLVQGDVPLARSFPRLRGSACGDMAGKTVPQHAPPGGTVLRLPTRPSLPPVFPQDLP
ncbi:hypothetical protein EBE87_20010 [Pseudoroseomonas wenyumeiae]|uniref:Uncharacterized protein n=1 Tax=Teichococcus wenyumeiae TaxID=2478470 RepID=A0A3A9JJ04_9PROT|nr:hypothetical protein [Pseudoroseomonas wenyumeiae]RKK03706.1 hypothetical protein D6Z83_13230 [Pseudoroseomonas wenyumeiae]RMI19440.1 hypothetical protein EBE87_20010 [Pseudoroseomonas wenyumeiae]